MENKIIRWRGDGGVRTALVVNEGRKFVTVIPADFPVRIRKIPLVETKNFVDVEYKGKPYPLKRAVRILKRMGKTGGITKAANKALKEAA